jgi:hypothetical protein
MAKPTEAKQALAEARLGRRIFVRVAAAAHGAEVSRTESTVVLLRTAGFGQLQTRHERYS